MPSDAARQINGLPNVNPFGGQQKIHAAFLAVRARDKFVNSFSGAVYIFPLSHAESERLVMPLSEASYNGILTVFALDIIGESPQCTYL